MKKKKTKMSTRDLSAGEVETGESLELIGSKGRGPVMKTKVDDVMRLTSGPHT